MKSRSHQLLDHSVSAMLSAIEIYNKPVFEHREETFSILAINAWELLLKARILQIDQNRLSSIMVYERRTKANGQLSEKYYRKKNRSGNQLSINLFKAFDLLVADYSDKLDNAVRLNLEALTEIRDNSIHFMNKDFDIKKKIYELGTANIKNFVNLIRKWFGKNLSEYNLFLMPIAFVTDLSPLNAINLNSEEKNLLNYFSEIESEIDDDVNKDFNLSLDIEINFKRVTDKSNSTKVAISNSSDAIPVKLSEEDIREKYPWDYDILTRRLKTRYSDFKVNQEYHQYRKPLEGNLKFCNPRLLDPGNPRSSKKNFYNPNILKEFDKKYTRANVRV